MVRYHKSLWSLESDLLDECRIWMNWIIITFPTGILYLKQHSHSFYLWILAIIQVLQKTQISIFCKHNNASYSITPHLYSIIMSTDPALACLVDLLILCYSQWITHLLSQSTTKLFRHPLCYWHSSYTSRLCATNLACHCETSLCHVLCYLGSLTTACLTNHN